MAVMMVMGVSGAWGQGDLTGVYYIANNNTNAFNASSAATNWYLVPASNGGDTSISNSAWQWNSSAETPLVTTYQTQKDNNSVWAVKKSGNYYNLIHIVSGKYVVYNAPVYTNRRAVHLQTAYPEDQNGHNAALFAITYQSGSSAPYNIRVEQLTSSHRFLNPSKGNKPNYYGLTDGGQTEVGGIIGIYDGASDNGSKWFLEDAILPAPTIVYDSEANTFTISYDKIPVGFDILYSTDGNDPTIGGSNTTTITTTTERNSGAIAVTGAYTVKAVVARYGLVLTEIASQPVGIPDNPTITLPTDCNNEATITAGGSPVYYTLDGTDPDKSSTPYTGSFVLNTDATIKAVSYNGNLRSAGITTLAYTPPYSAKPTISQNGQTITITGTGTIYYTDDGSEPGTGSSVYNGPITLSDGSGTMTIKAVAKDGTKNLSCVAEMTVSLGYFIDNITKLNNITNHLDERCIVINDIDASGLTASISGFTGEFDGGYYTISGLTKPLFTNLSGGVVKNVRFSGVNITSGTNVGTVCDEAAGTTKIYNCGVLSGSISGSGYVGGLVGHISSGSSVRVVNCYNNADVSSTGDYAAGIVGYNEGTVASNKTVGNVRIALCMMYGSVSGATHISPVYGGNHVSNVQNFTEYNYYLYSNERDANGNRIVKIPYTS